jgi:hypothetical protein
MTAIDPPPDPSDSPRPLNRRRGALAMGCGSLFVGAGVLWLLGCAWILVRAFVIDEVRFTWEGLGGWLLLAAPAALPLVLGLLIIRNGRRLRRQADAPLRDRDIDLD